MKTNTVTFNLTAKAGKWEIAPGKTVDAWTYNGQIPGPVLRAKKGDTLVVNLRNELNEPTTIHWHGLRLPAQMDGTEEVQPPVMPGETFQYRFQLPDAGTFWYHPHTNETVQMERGLYGVLIVEEEDEPVFDNERLLVFDDMKLNRRNEFKQPAWFVPRWLERHNGREGRTLLLNGKENPVFQMFAGHTERWRLLNVSNSKYIRLLFGGHEFKIIATDGGFIESPVRETELLIAPGERVEIAIGPFGEGANFEIESLPYNRGTGKGRRETFGKVRVGTLKPSVVKLPRKLRSILPIAGPETQVTKKVKLHGWRNWKTGVDFTINDQMHLHDEPVTVGELQVWEISNLGMVDHPFHLHGFFFQVLEVNGVAPKFLSWKDTVNVPRYGKAKIAWIPDNRPGKWMYHCHILEHAAAGMMAHFEVIEKKENYSHPTQSFCHA